MITDIENYTHFAEKLGHGRIATLTHEYSSLTLQRIVETGGELFSVDGDGVTVFWGSQKQSEQTKYHATSTAIDIIKNVKEFKRQHPDSPFMTQIGLESGWVEARYIGSKGNYRYNLVGDTTNTISRLKGLNKRIGTSVLATRAVIADVDKLVKRPMGVFVLKGKINKLEVFEVIDNQRLQTENERTMHERFTEVLVLIGQGQIEIAQSKLVNFLNIYEADGPARFYLDLLTGYNSADVHLDQYGVVHLDKK